jgi:signal transduction histidine kinase
VSSPIQNLVAELSHEINSPLAAIRNALYLVACRSSDPEVHRYLEIADDEVVRIAGILHASQSACGACYESLRSRSKAA